MRWEFLRRAANLPALEHFLRPPLPEEMIWPEWEELGVLGPESEADARLDVEFDR